MTPTYKTKLTYRINHALSQRIIRIALKETEKEPDNREKLRLAMEQVLKRSISLEEFSERTKEYSTLKILYGLKNLEPTY